MSPCLVILKLKTAATPSCLPFVITVAAPRASASSLRGIQADYGHEVGGEDSVTSKALFSADGGRGGGGVAGEVPCLVCSYQLLGSQRSFQGAMWGWGVGGSGALSSGGRGSGDTGVTPAAGRAGLMDGC